MQLDIPGNLIGLWQDLILFRDASENRTVRAWLQHSSTNLNTDSEVDAMAVDRVQRLLRRAQMLREWVIYEILSAQDDQTESRYMEKLIGLAKVNSRMGIKSGPH